MLSLQQFKDKYNGLSNQGDTPENMGQCTGLIELWLDNLNLNTPHLWGNAKDLMANADSSKFDIIFNNPNDVNQFPLPGDIPVWNGNLGAGLGHTAVVLTANGNNFSSLDQNWLNDKKVTVQTHDYVNLIGWLHPKITIPPTPPTSDLQAKYDALVILNHNNEISIQQKDAYINKVKTAVNT